MMWIWDFCAETNCCHSIDNTLHSNQILYSLNFVSFLIRLWGYFRLFVVMLNKGGFGKVCILTFLSIVFADFPHFLQINRPFVSN